MATKMKSQGTPHDPQADIERAATGVTEKPIRPRELGEQELERVTGGFRSGVLTPRESATCA